MHEDSGDKGKAKKYFSLSLWALYYRFIKKEEDLKTTTSLQTN